MKGKRAAPGPAESVRHRLKADAGVPPFGSPRSGPGDRDGFAPRYRGQSACAAGAGIAGGTAEGLPFVPIEGWKVFFIATPTSTTYDVPFQETRYLGFSRIS